MGLATNRCRMRLANCPEAPNPSLRASAAPSIITLESPPRNLSESISRIGKLGPETMGYLLLIVGLLVYYIAIWLLATPILRPRSVVTCYQAPAGLSPAAVRYVWMGGEGMWSGGADARSLAAMLADLAYRKQISIQCSGAELGLQRTPNLASGHLTDEERRVVCRLLPSTQIYSVAFDGCITYTPTRFELEKTLWFNLRDSYFTGNLRYRLIGIAATLAGVFLVCYGHASQWGSGKAIPVAALLAVAIAMGSLAIEQLRDAPRLGIIGSWLRPLAPYLTSAGLAIILTVVLFQWTNGAFAVFAAATLVINLLFGTWLRAPTPLGRQTLDEIAGYREFLESVERPILDAMSATDQTITGVDEHLGYVIALDVRDHWGDKLTSAIAQVMDQEERAANSPHAVDC